MFDIFELLYDTFINVTGIPYITDCVMAELEKLGPKYRIALKIIKDPRFERLTCTHKGTYADDCIVQRVTQVLILHIPLCLLHEIIIFLRLS